MAKETILVLDDDANLRKTLSGILATKGFVPITAASGREAIELAGAEMPAVSLIDLQLQDMSGLEALKAIKEQAPDTECIILTGHATQMSAIEAVNLGAYSYVQKPCDPEQLLLTIHRAIEKHQARRLLAKREHFFRTLLHSIQEDILVIDRDYCVVDVNDAALNTLGQSREEVVGRRCFEVTHRYNAPCVEFGEPCTFERVFETGEACQHLHIHTRRDGSQIHVNVLLSPIKDEQGTITHIVETARDVTQMQAMEQALRESEETYRTLVERAADGIVMIQDGVLCFVNSRMAEMLGYTVEELVGTPYDDFLAEDERPQAVAYYTQRMAGADAPSIYESAIVCKDGARLEVEFNAGLTTYQGQPADLVIVRDITERKHVEDALRRRAAQLALLNDVGEKVAAVLDLDSLLDRATRLVHGNFGYHHVALFTVDSQREELVMRAKAGAFASRFPSEHRLALGQGVVGWVAQTGQTLLANDVDAEPRYVNLFPDLIPTRSELSVPMQVEGRILGVLDVQSPHPNAFDENDVAALETLASQIAVALENARLFREARRELAERERAEKALRAEKERAQQYLDIAGVAFVALDSSGRITLVNNRLLDLLGYQEAELMGKDWFETCLPERVCGQVRAIFEQLMVGDTRAAGSFENIVVTKDGRERLVAWHNALLHNVKGEIVGTLSSGEDITERVQAENEIRRRNRELTLLNRIIAASTSESSTEALLETVCRELAVAFDVTQAAAALFNKEKTESVLVAEYRAEGRPSALGEIIPVAGNPASQHLLENRTPLVIDDARTDPRQAAVREMVRRRSTVSLLLLPLIVDGEVIGNLAVNAIKPRPFSAEETTLAQRVAEQVSGALARLQLEKTQQRLNAAIEQSAGVVLITDIQGNILYVNPSFERITGYSQAEVLGRNPRILKSGKQDAEFYENLWQTISSGQVWQGHFVNRKKDGSLYTEEATISPVRDRAGEIVNYVAVKYDVTREVELEQQFFQAQKMEAVGQLAGGVAHDFGNLLTVIHLSTRLLEKELHPHDVLWKHVERIQAAGQRASRLTKQLLSFSRKDVIEPQLLNLNEVLNDLYKMLRRMIREDIEMTLVSGEDLWPVYMDATHLDQIIVNLAVNARDAMPEGGALTIETQNVALDRDYAAAHLHVDPGHYVLMTIRDTGVGMTSEVKAHIFEPFFTTKEPGQGTGLGLATVYGIVERSGGHIQVESEVGKGSSFHIYLPRAEEGLELRQMVQDRTPVVDVRGTETVMVVEDADDVRELAVDILETYGYEVLAADSGPRALLLSRGYEGPIHLLLTDVVMPGMSGTELAAQLQTQRPEMRVLFTSGYTDEAIVHLGVLEESVSFLRKPFTLEGLTESVRAALDSEA